MNSSSKIKQLVLATCTLFVLQAVASVAAHADNSGLHFQRPGASRTQSERVNKNFRRPGSQAKTQAAVEAVAAPDVVRVKKVAKRRPAATKRVAKALPKPKPKTKTVRNEPARKEYVVRRDRKVTAASGGRVRYDSHLMTGLQLASHGCDICDGQCSCGSGYGMGEPSCGMYEPGCGVAEPGCGMAGGYREASCGMGEPSCGMYEPGCGMREPGCGMNEPSCGMYEPGCGVAEPGCGMAGGCGEGVGCGSCVARPGADYWCFPVCLPRFKDLSAWAGVHGFRGPRDFPVVGNQQRSDSNFGFQAGVNLSGRAPLLGLLFPQLSYQLGYQAVQSRLHGTTTSVDDRAQQFVTAGLFRRVKTGIQLGLAWDLMQDDLDTDIDLHQVRYEISLKSPQGREVGFWGTKSTNDSESLGLYQTVDQYAVFYRWAFGNGYESRLWGGATEDGAGLFGAEFHAPLSSRWEVQTGFNYLITDAADGLAAVSEESWNIGINMVWHLGRKAKSGCRSPYRPMFAVADNGWMFVKRK